MSKKPTTDDDDYTNLTDERYREEVNRQASHLQAAVEEHGGSHVSHIWHVLDGHGWFDGSNEPALHARIITLADAEVPLQPLKANSDEWDSGEELIRRMASYVFSRDVRQTAKEVM